MVKSVYNVLKNGAPDWPDRKIFEARGVQSALNIAFRTAPDLAEGEVLTIFRRRKDDRLQPLMQLTKSAPKAEHKPGTNGWITFERVGERLKIINFDYCGLDLLKISCALMEGLQFDAVDATTAEHTQRNVTK